MELSMFKPVTSVAKYFKVSVYGVAGTGKTVFALTFPDVAYIDMEQGATWYGGQKVIPEQNENFLHVTTSSSAEVIDTIFAMEKNCIQNKGKIIGHDGRRIRTLVIDPITVLWEALQEAYRTKLKEKRGPEADIQMNDWSKVRQPYKAVMTRLINLPINLVLIGREANEYEMQSKGSRKEFVVSGTKISAEKDTPYLTDMNLRAHSDKAGKRYLFRVEKDRTNTFRKGDDIEGMTYPFLLDKVRQRGLCIDPEDPQGNYKPGNSSDEVAKLDSKLFENVEQKVMAIIEQDESIVSLWKELDWTPGKVKAIAEREGLITREDIGKYLATHVRQHRLNKNPEQQDAAKLY